ncbi:YidC/Oxa1 family membrane protein insertase [Thermoleophilia bacterium SCSIO 60948]|nr:YidC/Oxa1 family membrane protein insertase [Thermoleophilia bacterium SCSIO 60948]
MIVLANILQPFIDAAEAVIKFFQSDVGLSWGLSIVALTFAVRLLVLPLSLRGIKSMRRMQVIGPQMKEIQERYSDDKERQQREMMKLYRDNKINPLASCFPFLLQIPFFIAIYQLLRGDAFITDVQDSGAPQGFLFVQSVIEKPEGVETILLIILFIVTTVLSFLYTTATTATAQGAQKYIFLALPVLFAPLIVSQPAGLAVYWITTNIWSLGQQVVVQKLIPAPTPEQTQTQVPAKAPPPPPRKKKRRR